MIRPSGKLKRFMSNADYQVQAKRTKKKNSRFVRVGAVKKQAALRSVGSNPLRRSDVASAPLKLLPDHAEERCIGQRGQWKRFLCLTDGDDRSALDVDRPPAIQRQVHWIIWMTRFDFDDRSIRDNDRAVRENVRANRRDDEHA